MEKSMMMKVRKSISVENRKTFFCHLRRGSRPTRAAQQNAVKSTNKSQKKSRNEMNVVVTRVWQVKNRQKCNLREFKHGVHGWFLVSKHIVAPSWVFMKGKREEEKRGKNVKRTRGNKRKINDFFSIVFSLGFAQASSCLTRRPRWMPNTRMCVQKSLRSRNWFHSTFLYPLHTPARPCEWSEGRNVNEKSLLHLQYFLVNICLLISSSGRHFALTWAYFSFSTSA